MKAAKEAILWVFALMFVVFFLFVIFSAGYGKALEDRCAEAGYGYKNGECVQVVDIDPEKG